MPVKTELLKFGYKNIVKPLVFNYDAEAVHNNFTKFGNMLGGHIVGREIGYSLFNYSSKNLVQKIDGLEFENPVGLAAGFDYNAQLTQILPSLGLGFTTIGTITNLPYSGNPAPRLGRLPKSKSLLVNKGFKNIGARRIAVKLDAAEFSIPTGISIGRSNSETLTTIDISIDDIVLAFETLEKAGLNHSYYELNISCPNLIHGNGKITFYPPGNLEKLLKKIDGLNLRRPVYIKMPITESDHDFLKMLDTIVKHKIAGIIVGNLEKDRANPAINKKELQKAGVGNFSGKPCFRRSNELISLAYKTSQRKLTIIGCGGVFNEHDAYEKIKRGANLIQMITGLVYEGPQVVGEINQGLSRLLVEDGYRNIADAVGEYYK